jgi:hypothetical protein
VGEGKEEREETNSETYKIIPKQNIYMSHTHIIKQVAYIHFSIPYHTHKERERETYREIDEINERVIRREGGECCMEMHPVLFLLAGGYIELKFCRSTCVEKIN